MDIYRYESIIATLCESLDTLDEPEAKVLVNANLIHLLYFHMETYFVFLTRVLISLGINDLDNWRIR